MNKIAQACRASVICGLWKNLQVLISSKNTQEKSFNYVLIVYVKKFKIA